MVVCDLSSLTRLHSPQFEKHYFFFSAQDKNIFYTYKYSTCQKVISQYCNPVFQAGSSWPTLVSIPTWVT